MNDGRYICIHERLNVNHLFLHLQGKITLGTYVLSKENQARFAVLDADDIQGFERLSHLGKSLAMENIPTYIEKSRRGGHLWLFFSKPIHGSNARGFTYEILAEDQDLTFKMNWLDSAGATQAMEYSEVCDGFFHEHPVKEIADEIYLTLVWETLLESIARKLDRSS